MFPEAWKNRNIRADLALAVPTLLWMVPLFGQLPPRYPYFGSMVLPMLVLAVLIAVPCGMLLVKSGALRKLPRKSAITTLIVLVVVSAMDGMMWAPCLNALLDFRDTKLASGEVRMVVVGWRGQLGRSLTATFRSGELETRFNDRFWWDVAAVRNGGPVLVAVGPGLFGIPWVAGISDTAISPGLR